MNLSQAKKLFAQYYPDGVIQSSKAWGNTNNGYKWGVCFEESGKVYFYSGSLRNILSRILPLSQKEKDILQGIFGRCGKGCPVVYTKDDTALKFFPGCPNCGNLEIKWY